jgi:hypothetical protein
MARLRALPLVAENFQHGRRGAYENQARLHASAREIRVLAQEAITGVDGIAAGAERDTNDLGRVEIRSGTLAGQPVSVVRFSDVVGSLVIFRENRMRAHAGLGSASGDPDRDLAAVGDEQIFQRHGYTSTKVVC